jgi:putative flippase GtrA
LNVIGIWRRLQAFAPVLAGTLMIMSVIALNGGPSVFTDTDDYFVEGRTFAITIAETLHLRAPPPKPTDPDDIADAKEAAADLHMSHTEIGARSPYYGLLLYSTHKIGTLWLTALVQSVFGAWLAFLFWRTSLPRARAWTAYLAEAAIAFTSTLPFFAAFAMPDVFAGYVAMAVVLLLVFWDRLSRIERTLLAVAAGVMMTFHTSHVLNTVATAALAGLLTRFVKPPSARSLASFIAVGAAVFGALLATGAYKEAVKLKTGDELRRPPFLAMRVLADGPGKQYLKDSCARGATWALCAFKDLPLDNSQDLLWSDDRKKGIFNVTTIETRLAIEKEENVFVLSAVAAHPFWQVGESMVNWAQQFGMWYVDDPIKNPHYYLTNAYWSTTNLPLLINTAKDCGRDHWGCGFKLSIDGSIWLHGTLLFLSLGAIGWRLGQRDIFGAVRAKAIDWEDDNIRLGVALSLLVAVVLVNAFVCGALSGPFPRYQARINWLVSEAAAVGLISMAPMFASLRLQDGLAWSARLVERLRQAPLVARFVGRLDGDFPRFAMVGVAGFTVDYAVLHSLVAFAGLNPYAARFISFPVAVVATWLLNRSFTFRKPSAHGPVRQAVYYVAVQGAGGVANIAVYAAALALAPVLKSYLPIALALGSAAGLCVTFAGSKYIAFRAAEIVEIKAAEAG